MFYQSEISFQRCWRELFLFFVLTFFSLAALVQSPQTRKLKFSLWNDTKKRKERQFLNINFLPCWFFDHSFRTRNEKRRIITWSELVDSKLQSYSSSLKLFPFLFHLLSAFSSPISTSTPLFICIFNFHPFFFPFLFYIYLIHWHQRCGPNRL